MIWLAAGSAATAAATLVLLDPKPPVARVELAAVGWSSARIAALSLITAAALTAMVLLAGTAAAGVRVGAAAALAVAVWTPHVMPKLIRAALQTGYRSQRDRALIGWLRRIRLLVAAGRPINAAAVEAAARISDPAFSPCAEAIAAALSTGRDPMVAASRYVAGSPAEILFGTLISAEAGGAAAISLIDRLLAQAAAALEADCRDRIDRLGRSNNTTASVIAALAGVVLMASVAFTLT